MKTRSAYNPRGFQTPQLADTALFSDANLVSYYKLEGNSNDAKGSNNGTDTAITYNTSNGKFGQGAGFNGTSSKIVSTPTLSNTLSISAWCNWNGSLSTSWRCIAVGGSTAGNSFGIFASGGNFWAVTGSTAGTDVISSTTVTQGWHHLVGTLTGTTLTLYLDGVQIATGTKTIGTITNNFSIGSGVNPDWFPGAVDDVAVFTKALSASEVSQLYYSGSTKAYYPLNGNSIDYSGNGNHGTETAITYPQGRFGQGAKLNGSSSKIALTGTTFPVSGDFTMSIWYKGTTPTGDGLVGYGSALATGQRRSILIVSGNAYFGGYSADLDSNTKVVDGRWHNILVTYTGTTCSIYVDGVIRNTSTLTLNTTNQVFRIGCRADDTSFINAEADEVIIESRAWTAAEVSTYYKKSMMNYGKKSYAQIVYTYITELLKGSYTITGKNIDTLYNRVATLLKGAYTLTGKQLTSNKAYVAQLLKGTYNLVGKILTTPNRWRNQTKNTSTWTDQSKNSSTWTNRNKS